MCLPCSLPIFLRCLVSLRMKQRASSSRKHLQRDSPSVHCNYGCCLDGTSPGGEEHQLGAMDLTSRLRPSPAGWVTLGSHTASSGLLFPLLSRDAGPGQTTFQTPPKRAIAQGPARYSPASILAWQTWKGPQRSATPTVPFYKEGK